MMQIIRVLTVWAMHKLHMRKDRFGYDATHLLESGEKNLSHVHMA